ncbi:ankyrin repeat domain-containing protein [Streptomyces boninensis]|uniref:ankyrin repeat domain-containing protein n=1 Tax=Streptomyces boninensis TaxID=2039455 RepID=UPI003B22573E
MGSGPDAKVLLTGWSVWPRSVTLHLAVFFRTRWRSLGPSIGGRQSGLRVGLLLADGRRVTSLDGTIQRMVRGPGRRPDFTQTSQAIGLIPLDTGLGAARRSRFRTDVDLYLAELPPAGEAQLVVEWPDEGIAETRVPVDVAALRAAAGRVVEVWPGLEPPEPEAAGPGPAGRSRVVTYVEASGPPGFLAPPLTEQQLEARRREEEARLRYVPRADWEGMVYEDWADVRLIRARLEGGAPVDEPGGRQGTTPLLHAAKQGSGEAVAELLSRQPRPRVDAEDEDGHTPLWYAACRVDAGCVRALIEAGADVWTPQVGPWSPGRLLLTTPLASMVAELPGAVELPAAEVAAFRAADALIAAFGRAELFTEGLGIAFVRGVTEAEVLRRLGADPARCRVVDSDDLPFDREDFEESLRHVAVTRVRGRPGGCVITQSGYLPGDGDVLRPVSVGTVAYGVYFNPKGGTPGTLARDGEVVMREEIGLWPREADPAAHWHFRFWQRCREFPYDAGELAYACAAAGMRIEDGAVAVDRRGQRWVRLGGLST